MNDSASAKQQIVEKIKNSTNILVTVNTNPTVDELTAALGLTMLINKLKKHSTAVVSGDIPPAIEFLEPGKTFENTVDSLRDFIIALDKEKADHLRYKVDGDVVKIFITPYRTTIGSDDLDFSQGDYNVELVLALNVINRDNLDRALAAHGRILHDATVATISSGEASNLGSIDWQDSGASSLSEMLVALSEALKDTKPLLDEQIATAFLTGIVAATDRFSNEKTSSRVMTMAAQLMAAGANQQLIAAKLEEAEAISHPAEPQAEPDAPAHEDGTTEMNETESVKLERTDEKAAPAKKPKNDGSLTIDHDADGNSDDADESDDPAAAAEARLTAQLNGLQAAPAAASSLSVADLQADLKNANQQIEAAADTSSAPTARAPQTAEPAPAAPANTPKDTAEPAANDDWSAPAYEETPAPTFGGTLNATTEAAAETKRAEIEADRNNVILSHGGKGQYLQDESTGQNPVQAAINSTNVTEPSQPDNPFAAAAEATGLTTATGVQPSVFEPLPPLSDSDAGAEPTLAQIDSQHRGKPLADDAQGNDDPRAAVEAAFGAVPFDPAHNPQVGVGAQPFGEVPRDAPQSAVQMPPMPPMPDFSTLPPLPPSNAQAPITNQAQPEPAETLGDIFGTAAGDTQPIQPPEPPADPTQFKIPGQ